MNTSSPSIHRVVTGHDAHGKAVVSQNGALPTAKGDSPHPLMHHTETVDYGIVIEGEIVLVLDDSEAALKPGGVVIQRGTNHTWANRTDRPCRMLFVLVDGQYDPELQSRLNAASR
jgi:mannose-6-phosphate isomerase-like protein (cupin superfamily)